MRAWFALLLLPLVAYGQSSAAQTNYGDGERKDEAAVTLPQYPTPENFLPFEVNATTPFLFFVDAKSLSIGADQVVRYSLIAKSADGALNVSYEGMRCANKQFRIYAFGRSDNTWSESRNSRWEPIRTNSRNAPREALHSDYFCPSSGSNIVSAEEGVRVLKRGGNPRANRNSY